MTASAQICQWPFLSCRKDEQRIRIATVAVFDPDRVARPTNDSAFSIPVANLQDMDAVTSLLEASYSNLLTLRYDPEALAKALPIVTKANTRLLAFP
jgi:hypothetical protein